MGDFFAHSFQNFLKDLANNVAVYTNSILLGARVLACLVCLGTQSNLKQVGYHLEK